MQKKLNLLRYFALWKETVLEPSQPVHSLENAFNSADVGLTIVGIGASAGGLEACKKLLAGLSAGHDMAFILILHLDPAHKSMMPDLLTGCTKMTVLQATDGMRIEADHLYIIPPGYYLSVSQGALRLSLPKTRREARLPFDFLLDALAREYGARAIGVVLSGMGGDGSLGLKALKEKGGLIIAQTPEEAGYKDMPKNAIATGCVDLILPVDQIPKAIENRNPKAINECKIATLTKIVDLLYAKTPYDFAHYKPGTLQRRTERRMGMLSIGQDNMDQYLALLQDDENELGLLSKDLFINVTSFFRDPETFDFLAKKTIPDLIANHVSERPLRVWCVGCSTGEEAYSLAILFFEAFLTTRRSIRLQIFASDIDQDAVSIAREGYYPDSIEADLSPTRLARFFSKEERGYRISPELRAVIVFAVHNVLADPPFSRLDLISCRNLLIYLRSDAQAKVASHFHFALREGGFLLFGSAEAIDGADKRFTLVSRSQRLYQRTGLNQREKQGSSRDITADAKNRKFFASAQAPPRQTVLAELCRRLVLETYAPAAALIDRDYKCLYYLGPIDAYLKLSSGHPFHDLLAMVSAGLRIRLKAAILQARQENARIVTKGGCIIRDGESLEFNIEVRPAPGEDEELLLVCFVDAPASSDKSTGPSFVLNDLPHMAELEKELEDTRIELQNVIHNFKISSEEQSAANEEALSANEEFQSTNEELLASKEELQSLNEELTALNNQLQETLEDQRTTFNDLQNVLYSTDVATIFLDTDLKIRFFTPATRQLFNVIPGDIGRPLSDLSLLAIDKNLMQEAKTVLQNFVPCEQEVKAQSGAWYTRRILPYRIQNNGVEGVVITFVDITDRKRIADALETARREAELANVAKSRFLAAASHDLRQPLQSLLLFQGALADLVKSDSKAETLVKRLNETVGVMSDMLDALLDINRIETGMIAPHVSSFPVNDLLKRLKKELICHAHAKNISLRFVPCGLFVESDSHLLEQMIRNLISNALKYTQHGRVLVGCRRRGEMLRIEVWDTGIGIPATELHTIFEEYHQLANSARERNLGLGLGLSIVRRLGLLLKHPVHVQSRPGKGSVFSIEVKLTPEQKTLQIEKRRHDVDIQANEENVQAAMILVIEDDPEIRLSLKSLLAAEGYSVAAEADGVGALELIRQKTIRPDLILSDYNLPNGKNGLEIAMQFRVELCKPVPVVVLTGDISTRTLKDIAAHDCLLLSKPVKPAELLNAIRRLLSPALLKNAAIAHETGRTDNARLVFVVDDDDHIRKEIRRVLENDGIDVEDYSSCEDFIDAYRSGREACLLIDAFLPGMNGFELMQWLRDANDRLPAIMITGASDVSMAVRAMKGGAIDFLEKPVSRVGLLASIGQALELARDEGKSSDQRADAARRLASLTPRQRQIMDLVLAGNPSKNIAADVGISQRTVENHRASIMKKTGAKSLPALARMALVATAQIEPDL